MTRNIIGQLLEALEFHLKQTRPIPQTLEAIAAAHEYLASEKQPSYGWLIACDDALICSHLGVAELSHSYEYAKKRLSELIDWHVAVATDPAVNGGFSLQLQRAELTDERLKALEDVATVARRWPTYPELMEYLQSEIAAQKVKHEYQYSSTKETYKRISCYGCDESPEAYLYLIDSKYGQQWVHASCILGAKVLDITPLYVKEQK